MPPTPPGADMPPTTSSDAEGIRRRLIAFRNPLGPLLKAHVSAFRPVLRFTDFNGHNACGHERGHGRSISRGNKRSGGGHSAQCRGSWLPSVLHVPVALCGSNRRSEANAAKIICQLHPPPRYETTSVQVTRTPVPTGIDASRCRKQQQVSDVTVPPPHSRTTADYMYP